VSGYEVDALHRTDGNDPFTTTTVTPTPTDSTGKNSAQHGAVGINRNS